MNAGEQILVQWLARPEGRLAFTLHGSGPLIVAVPGMGDIRQTWDQVVPGLVAAGYRVAVMDIRGHGQSDTSFTRHGDAATAEDIVALVDHLGSEGAVLLGNSMSATAAVIAAGMQPQRIAAVVTVNGFLRDEMPHWLRPLVRVLYRIVFARWWGAACWVAYYRTLNKGRDAPGLDAHVALLRNNLREPDRLRSLRELCLQLDHLEVSDWIDRVTAPVLAIYGDRDPDFKNPQEEAQHARNMLKADTVMMSQCGHYPQHQRPVDLTQHVVDFLAGVRLPAD